MSLCGFQGANPRGLVVCAMVSKSLFLKFSAFPHQRSKQRHVSHSFLSSLTMPVIPIALARRRATACTMHSAHFPAFDRWSVAGVACAFGMGCTYSHYFLPALSQKLRASSTLNHLFSLAIILWMKRWQQAQSKLMSFKVVFLITSELLNGTL